MARGYTVVTSTGTVLGRGLTAREAMHTILSDDGHDYDIRPAADNEGFDLWTSPFSRNSTVGTCLRQSTVWSLSTDLEMATDEIALKVIQAGWKGPEALPDEEYDEITKVVED